MPNPTYPDQTATGMTTEGVFKPFELFAGDGDVDTDSATVGATAIEQFRVIAFGATGLVVPFDPAGAGPIAKAIGVAMQAGPIGGKVPYATEGQFNHEVLIWPAATNTLDLRRAAFAGTPIQVRGLLGSPDVLWPPT